jgi:hypothetical protein
LLRAGAPASIETCNGAAWPEAAPPRVEIVRAQAGARVQLLQPREPLAWSIDPSWSGAGIFQTVWHSERAPGARAVGARNEAEIAGACASVGVRVFHDDGSVATHLAGD